jgi:hypothetical protein
MRVFSIYGRQDRRKIFIIIHQKFLTDLPWQEQQVFFSQSLKIFLKIHSMPRKAIEGEQPNGKR